MVFPMEDQDIPGVMQITRQPRARWTAFLTKVLVGLMVDQVHSGNRRNNTFNKKAWSFISDGFFSITGLKWDKQQRKNKYSVLRRQFALVKKLLNRSDFTLDQSTGNFSASDEAWADFKVPQMSSNTMKQMTWQTIKSLCLVQLPCGKEVGSELMVLLHKLYRKWLLLTSDSRYSIAKCIKEMQKSILQLSICSTTPMQEKLSCL